MLRVGRKTAGATELEMGTDCAFSSGAGSETMKPSQSAKGRAGLSSNAVVEHPGPDLQESLAGR